MRNKTKMFILMGLLIFFGILYQIVLANRNSWIVGGILLSGIGFGWYACKEKTGG